MSITAKPVSYTVNTGHAKCPDHLWMLDEGTGTSAADKGKGTALALTLDNASMWGTDGGGLGSIITSNSSGPLAALSATGTLPSTSIVLVCLFKSASSTSGTNERPMTIGNSGINGQNYAGMRVQTNEAMDAVFHDGSGVVSHDANLPMYDTNWHLLAFKAKSGNLAASVDGGSWSIGTPSFTYPNVSGSAPHRFGIGGSSDINRGEETNGSFLAAFAYDNLYDTADDTWIASLFSDPWQFLNTGGGKLRIMMAHNE